MSTITRETLELAALAAGHTIYSWYEPNGDGADFADIGLDECIAWAPHLDDGDAARLAVRLRMWVDWIGDSVQVQIGGSVLAQSTHDGTEPDKLRAWREAVVLCAAAVGERMRGER